jgi:predicted dehydrogenase
MRYCLIGCGRVSPEHIRAAKNNGLEICAVCDIDPESAKANLGFAPFGIKGLGHPATPGTGFYTDYREMLAQEKPELIAIATPSGLHAQMALDCLAAGAHVIVEKPIAMTLEDAQKLIKAADETGLVVCNNLQNRFNPAVRALREAVEAGRFGPIYSAALQLRWHRGDEYYRQAAWRGTRALDGGAMMNQGIHGIDLLNWMLDGPAEIAALTARLARGIECEDLGVAAVRYRNGALASIECTTTRYPQAEEEIIEISGERGCVRLGGTAGHVVETWRFDDAAPGEEEDMRRRYCVEPETVYGHGHSLLYADALRAIAEGRQPLVDARVGRAALAVVLGAYESAQTGRTVRLN